jgi:hypothetical protein
MARPEINIRTSGAPTAFTIFRNNLASARSFAAAAVPRITMSKKNGRP